jgi:alpha-beta hydrolase superfamily lysophospholipase
VYEAIGHLNSQIAFLYLIMGKKVSVGNGKEKKTLLLEYENNEFWKNYMNLFFGGDLIQKWEGYVEETSVPSFGKQIHLEIFDSNDNSMPIIIFSHGIAGYGRIMLPFIIPLREKGITVIVPDLQGYGYNLEKKGVFTYGEHVQNLIDVVNYTKTRYSRKIILAGGSMGGPLAYEAVSRGADVTGVICWCLWQLNNKEYIRNHTKTKKATPLLLPFLQLFAKIWGSFRIKTPWVIGYDTLSDIGSGLDKVLLHDPQAGRYISIAGVVSLMKESTPSIDYEKFEKPILIFHPNDDIMVPASFSEEIFRRIGSKKKHYFGIDGASHFPLDKKYYIDFTEMVLKFIKNGFFDDD